jgi:hypothetical protein
LQLSAKKAILTCFLNPCQALGFLIRAFFAAFANRLDLSSVSAAAISEDHDYSMLFKAVNWVLLNRLQLH